jgi:anti-sigma-K factor RskA
MIQDMHTLAGAYALDAVDDDLERRRFEDHLAGCPECSWEVATFAETAARMGAAVAVDPPPALKQRVFAGIDQVRQVPPSVGARRARRTRPKWQPWLAVATAAACLAAATVFGVTALNARNELARVQQLDQQVAAVLTAPDSRIATAAAKQGGRGTVVVSRSRGKMVFLADGLADLPEGRVYQLWQVAPEGISSAGLLSAEAGGRTAPVVAAPVKDAKLGVTVEPDGGSQQPTTKPLFLVDVPAA